jgi:TPR repeat protein
MKTLLNIAFLCPALVVMVFGFLNTGYCDEVKDSLALYNLGIKYHYGQGVPVNYQEAMKWYLKAAE